jgi:hypothetical protein
MLFLIRMQSDLSMMLTIGKYDIWTNGKSHMLTSFGKDAPG